MAVSLNDIKTKIASTKNTSQITNAMQMVSAAKLGRSEEAARNFQVYAQKVRKLLTDILHGNGSGGSTNPMLISRPVKKTGYIVITSDRGLVGGYNASILKAVMELKEEYHPDGKDFEIICIGGMGADFFKARGIQPIYELRGLADQPSFDEVRKIISKTIEMYQNELTYLVKHLICTMYPVQPYYEGAMCVCGTGGDGSNSFNISTTVAFIVASAGVPVVKHGNKSITSHSGSTDVLQAMGIQTSKVASVIDHLNTRGLSFISATDTYPIMKYIQPIRKQIKSPTIFNLVGPLINPFKLTYQVMGVYDVTQLAKIAQTIKDLGRKRAIVIHGANGMDEATLSGDNII